MSVVYVNPFTDFGFKKIFGEEASKPQLMDFLNAILKERGPITNLTFKNNEQLGQSIDAKGVIFDIYCENESGEKFIVELQKNKQDWFKERTVYYSTFPIQEQVEKGTQKYELKAVYCIGILDFVFNDYPTEAENNDWYHEIKLKDNLGKVFYDKLTFIFLEMPNYKKKESELVSQLDKWIYFIKYLEDFQNIPEIFKNEVVFVNAFEKAELAKLTKAQYDNYQKSIKAYRDLYSVLDTAENKGKQVGIDIGIEIGIDIGDKQRQIKMAINCIKEGMKIDQIALLTELSLEEIRTLMN